MKIHISKYALSVFLLTALTACASSQPALKSGINNNFGVATRININAHAVAPSPSQKANTFIPVNPARDALARKKYENGETK